MNRLGWKAAVLLGVWIAGGASGAAARAPSAGDEPAGAARGAGQAADAGQGAAGGATAASADDAAGGHVAGAHNEFDLTHGNATDNLESPEEFKYDLAIYTLVVFLLFMTGLLKFAWRPIVTGLDKREQSIANMIEEARLSSEKAAAQLAAYEAQLAAAADEARTLVAQARADAEAAGERIKSEAHQAAERAMRRAVDEITAAKNTALHEVANKGADVAFLLAGKIMRRDLSREDHADLVREALGKVPSKN